MIITKKISCVSDIFNALILFQFVSIVFTVKQSNCHLNKRLNNWIIGAVTLNKANVKCRQLDKAVDQVNLTRLFVSSV
jgi:hypothetical protein